MEKAKPDEEIRKYRKNNGELTELRDLINILLSGKRIKHSAEELQVNAIVAKDLATVLCTNKTDNTRFGLS